MCAYYFEIEKNLSDEIFFKSIKRDLLFKGEFSFEPRKDENER